MKLTGGCFSVWAISVHYLTKYCLCTIFFLTTCPFGVLNTYMLYLLLLCIYLSTIYICHYIYIIYMSLYIIIYIIYMSIYIKISYSVILVYTIYHTSMLYYRYRYNTLYIHITLSYTFQNYSTV